jgi:mRNA interferase MazF
MNPGDVVLLPLLLVAGGGAKIRPTLYLAPLPGPYQTMLVCGMSTQLHTIRPNWDELIQPGDADFATSGLRQASVIRLSYLRTAQPTEVTAIIGHIDPARLARLRTRLADQVRP